MSEVSTRSCVKQWRWLRIPLHIMLCLLAVSVSSNLFASTTPLNHYFQESWSTRDGLPHNTINSITQSTDGYLWLGSWEGAARFNGREFEVFGRGPLTGLPDSGIRALNKDNQGRLLLAGARGGISRRNGQDWTRWPALDVLLNAVVEDDRQQLWLASEGQGVFRQTEDGKRTQFTTEHGLPSDVVQSLLKDSSGTLWVGSGQGLARMHDKDGAVSFERIEGLPAVPVFVLRQYGNSVLIGTERGLYIYRDSKAELFSEQLSQFPVSALLVDGEQIWIGSTDRGLLRLSELGLESLSMKGGLPNNRILALYKDKENSIWVGTNGGLFRLRDAPFVTYTTEHGLAGDYVRAVLAHSDGSVWLGTSQGVSRFDGKAFHTIDLAGASKGNSILSLVEAADGAVWIGTYTDGVLRYQNGSVTTRFNRSSGLLANEVRAVLPDQNGGLWVGTSLGLNYIDNTGIRNFGSNEGLPSPFVIALYQHHDGRLFIGTGGGVVIRDTDGTMQTLDFSVLDGAEYAFGFMPDPVADLLWMTTDRGLVAYELSTGRSQIIGRSAGLPFDKVFQVIVDKTNNIWLSSNRGILHLDRHQVEQVLNGDRELVSYELFGESDGMQSAQANGGSMQAAAISATGSVFIATSKGVSIVNPADLSRFSINIPPIVIENLTADGVSLPLIADVKLAAGTERITLLYAGLGYIMPQRIQYSTKLEGFDSDWVERGNSITAEYTNLPPGEYSFSVRAAYPRGGWSEQPARFKFTIAPYYWQRPVFWFACAVIAILLAGIAMRWRLNSLHRKEQHLRLQVAEKTFELQQQADHLRAIDQERSELLKQIRRQAQEFEIQARKDALTGLANRRAFDEAMTRECARARRNMAPLCLVLLDIDHFKQVNDSYSHSIGDDVLKMVAELVASYCRTEDTVARWGGEEFAILLPGTTLEAAEQICQRIRQAVMQTDFSAVAADLHITVSMGLARYEGELQHDKLLSHADAALYNAKEAGRNRVTVMA